MKTYKYYDLLLGAYVCVLLCANLIGPAKVSTVHVPVFGDVTFVAGVLFFPFSYFFGDVLTEVYGFARDRRFVWSGFGALLFASLMATVVVHLPPADFWKDKEPAVEAIFGSTPRIIAGSIIGFTAYVWLIHHESPTKVGTYAYVNPLVAVLVGYFLGGEALGPRTIVGTLLVLISVVVITTTPAKKSQPALQVKDEVVGASL